MQYLYGKVDTKMNEVFETVAEVLEELRSEAGEREYSVCTKEAIFEEYSLPFSYISKQRTGSPARQNIWLLSFFI